MGTSKKIVLASIVSMLMVLGFLVGLAPSGRIHTEAATAAGDSIDMVGLLDLVLGVKAVDSVTVDSPVEGVLVKTPEDNFITPEIPVPVQASVVGDGSELVTFVANDKDSTTAFPGGQTWSGDVFTEATPSPFVSALDLGSFVTGVAGTNTELAVYALVNATAAATKAATLTYEAANEPADALPLTIFETDGNVDGDNNGYPDNPFADIAPGEVWISNQQIGGQLRTVLVANVDNSTTKGTPLGTIFTSPNGHVQVESPSLLSLVAAGAIAPGESGFLLVNVVNDLAGTVDEVEGGGSVATWASDTEALQPGALLTGAQYIEISLIYSLYGGTQFDEINTLPNGLTVNVTLSGLTTPANTTAGLYHYPTNIVNTGGNVNVQGATGGTWEEVDATFAGGGATAALTDLSVFAALGVVTTTPIQVTAASPNTVPEDIATDVTLTGVFATTVALNAAQAAAAYTVTVGGVPATFLEVGGVAISANNGGTNTMNITVPGNANPGFYDVTVTDANDNSNTATAAGLIEVLATSDLATSVTGGVGTITVTPSSGTGLPAGTYFTETVVSASLAFDTNQKSTDFAGWVRNGVNLGTANPINIIVGDLNDDDALTTLTAQLINVIDTVYYSLAVNATAGGSASAVTAPNGPNNDYAEGTVVTITATPNAGFEFTGWSGSAVDDANSANTTITMTADSSVTANFAPIAYSVDLTVFGNEGGTVAILTPPNHPNGVDYLLGTVITIQATAEGGYQFDNWSGPQAGVLGNPNAATTTFTVDGNQPSYEIAANFSLVVNVPSITDITPSEGWIFGGVVARISGTGLADDTIITIGGVQVQGFRAFSNGSSVDVVIPASTDNTTAATVAVDVTVSNGVDPAATLPNGFTYKRYQTEDGVNTTAFIVDNPEIGTTVDVTLNGANNSFAELEIPALNVPAGAGNVFGIARNAIVGDAGAKGNTAAIGALGTNSIAAGAAIDGISDFSLHLYVFDDGSKGNTNPVGANTPSVGSGTLSSASGLVDFGGPIDPDGNPADSTPVLLSFPLTGTGLTYGDVRNSLTLWGVQTEFDYVTEVTTISDPEVVAYQSEILNTEVDPELLPGSADSAEPSLISQARIYSLNGFSLRQNAIVDSDVAEGIRLANVSGTANGNVSGGTALRVISPLGGIGHIDRIVFTEAVSGKAVGGTVTAANIVTPAGATEYEVEFTSPASADKGIANIVIFGKADPSTPIVQLDRVFEYTKEPRDLTRLALLLLGLLVAGLGLAAGGDSGGGGGGPCFIATAAYGTPMAAQIDTLRDVRDSYLLSNTVGSAFTDTYYRVSPTIADAVAQSPVLAAAVRVVLVPVIFLGKLVMAMPALTAFIGMSLGAALFMARRRAGRSAL